jgi:hypothetical protein
MYHSPDIHFNIIPWRRLPADALEERILVIRRASARQHLSLGQWRELDRMRRRLARLKCEALS